MFLFRRAVVHVVDWLFLPFYPNLATLAASTGYFNAITAAIVSEGTYADAFYGRTPFGGVAFAPTDE